MEFQIFVFETLRTAFLKHLLIHLKTRIHTSPTISTFAPTTESTRSIQYRIKGGFTMDCAPPIAAIILTPEISRTNEQNDYYEKMTNALSTEVLLIFFNRLKNI